MPEPKRLDLALLEAGLVSTRTKAQELVAAGKVSVNGKVVKRPGEKIEPGSRLDLSEHEHPYVSRGGLKLESALREFNIGVKGLRALDIGQSTGGFSHCLLLNGAGSIVGVDVGTGQLATSLKSDPRVTCFEKTDIRSLDPKRAAPPFPFFVVDLSFISLTLVLPALPRFLEKGAEGVLLVKPQFEVGPDKVGSGGIVRDAAARERAVERVRRLSEELGFTVAGETESPITGGDGNVEFLLHLRWLG